MWSIQLYFLVGACFLYSLEQSQLSAPYSAILLPGTGWNDFDVHMLMREFAKNVMISCPNQPLALESSSQHCTSLLNLPSVSIEREWSHIPFQEQNIISGIMCHSMMMGSMITVILLRSAFRPQEMQKGLAGKEHQIVHFITSAT